MFKVLDFQYDNKSSLDFNLKLINMGEGNKSDPIGIPLRIEDHKIKRIAKPFFYGVETVPNLTFTLQMAYIPDNGKEQNVNYISRGEMGAIVKWLAKREYKEFKILDTDYSNIVYNCMFQNFKQVEVGNYPFVIQVDVICDRPYGYRKQTITKTVAGSNSFSIQNLGFDNYYIFPEVEITNGIITPNVSITNITDNNNVFTFTGLNNSETVYVDNLRQEIISSTGLNRNSNFNFNWFRLTSDYYNSISVTGNCTVTFRFEFPMPV
jgi:hypothetical protein